MAAVRFDDENSDAKILIIVVNVPLIFDPNTTAPVYLNGNLAAIPYTEFWKIPQATKDHKLKVDCVIYCPKTKRRL